MRRVLVQLSAMFAVAVVVLCGAGIFHDRPDWAQTTRAALGDARDTVVAWAGDASDSVQTTVTAWLSEPAPKARASAPTLRGPQDDNTPTRVAHAPAPRAPQSAPAPQVAQAVPAPTVQSQPAPQAPSNQVAQAEQAPAQPQAQTGEPSPDQIVRVRDRLRASLTDDLYRHFDLFLYVSKADHGPWAQHMFVFAKEGDGLRLLHAWPVSTGRESSDRDPHGQMRLTSTPAGYYELDPHRMLRHHVSGQWNQPMPFAMFFNWIRQGAQTGLAIHGAGAQEEIALLGTRASAGCVRLSPDHAAALFDLVRENYRGEVPRFATDNRRYSTMSNHGDLMRNESGDLVFADGYRVLVYIDAYGGEELVSALF